MHTAESREKRAQCTVHTATAEAQWGGKGATSDLAAHHLRDGDDHCDGGNDYHHHRDHDFELSNLSIKYLGKGSDLSNHHVKKTTRRTHWQAYSWVG